MAIHLADNSFESKDSPRPADSLALQTPGEDSAIHLAESSFEPSTDSQRPRSIVPSPSEAEALRLAEGRLTPAEEKAIADGDEDEEADNPVGSTRITDLELAREFASASERAALRLAEGRISNRQARAIADGGELPARRRRAMLRGGRGRHEEQDEFSLPEDSNVEQDVVYGRPGDRDRAAEALLKEAGRPAPKVGRAWLARIAAGSGRRGTSPESV